MSDVEDYERRIRKIVHISKDSREKLLKEAEKLSRLPIMSQEAAVITTYLDACLELPWDAHTKDRLDLKKAHAKLDRDHYGLQKVKERIIECLAVHQLAERTRGQIICLVGPPGVGKTSIARSVAEARDGNMSVCLWAAYGMKATFAATGKPMSVPCPGVL